MKDSHLRLPKPLPAQDLRLIIKRYHGPLIKETSGYLWSEKEIFAVPGGITVEVWYDQTNWRWHFVWGRLRRWYWQRVLGR